METDPYTDPDTIQALYTNPEDEVTLVAYLADAAFIQMGLMPASGWGVMPAIQPSADPDPEVIDTGGELPGDDEIWKPRGKMNPDLDQDLNSVQ